VCYYEQVIALLSCYNDFNMFRLPALIAAILVVFAPSALASSEGALREFRDNYHEYRRILAEFRVSREEYLKWKTLSARDGAVASSRRLLCQAAELLDSYFSLLQTLIEEQPGFEPGAKSLALSVIEERRRFYSSFKERVEVEEKLSGLEELSEEFGSHYEKGKLEAEFIQTLLSLARLAEVQGRAETFAAEVRGMVEGDAQYPGRERILSEWLVRITKRLESSREAQAVFWTEVQQFSRLEQEYRRKQVLRDVLEAAESSRISILQVVDHLLEIVRRRKY